MAPAAPLTDYDAIAARIRAVPGVTAAMPVVDGQVLLTDERGTSAGGYRARHPPGRSAGSCRSSADHILAGSLDDFTATMRSPSASALAQRFGLGIGGSMTLVSPQGAATAFGTIPRIRAYKVVAIFQVGHERIRHRLRVPAAGAAQIFFQKPNAGDADRSARRRSRPCRARACARSTRRSPARRCGCMDWRQSNNSSSACVQVRAEHDVPRSSA